MADDVSVVFGAQIAGLVAGVEEAKAEIEGLRAPVDSFVSSLGGIAEALGVAFAVDKIKDFAVEMAELGERTLNSAYLLGQSVGAYAQLSGAFILVGGNAEESQRAIERVALSVQRVAEGNKTATAAFNNLGISTEEVKAKSNDLTGLLTLVITRYAELEPSLRNVGVLHEVAGRGAERFAGALRSGAEGWQEALRGAEDYRRAMEENAGGMAGSEEQINKLKLAVMTLSADGFGLIKPAVDGVVNALTAFIDGLDKAIGPIKDVNREMSGWEVAFRIVMQTIKDTVTIFGAFVDALKYVLTGLRAFAESAAQIFIGLVAEIKAALTGGSIEAAYDQMMGRLEAITTSRGAQLVALWQGIVARINSVLGTGPAEVTLPKVSVTTPRGGRALGTESGRGGKEKKAKEEKDDSDAIALERLSSEQKIDDIILDRRTKLIQASFEAHKISLASEYDLLVQNADKKWASDQSYYEKKKALEGNDLKELVKLNDEEAVAYQQYLTKRQELDTQYYEKRRAAEEKAAADSKAAWDKVFAGIDSSFQSAITGFIQGTTTLQQALQRAFQSVLIDPLIKNVENGLKSAVSSAFSGTDIANTFIGKFFSGTLFGSLGTSAAAGQVEVLGTASTTAAAQVTAFGAAAASATAALGTSATAGTASAAGGVASAASGGGFFSWLGGLFGFERGGIVPSAQGGWAVPAMAGGGVLAQLHSREMVLPASLSSFIQNAASRAGNSYSNASLNYAPVYNSGGGSAQMLPEQFFRQHGSRMMGEIRRAVASGWRP